MRKWAALVEEASNDAAFLEQAQEASEAIADRGPDTYWQYRQEELKKYLPLAQNMGIRNSRVIDSTTMTLRSA